MTVKKRITVLSVAALCSLILCRTVPVTAAGTASVGTDFSLYIENPILQAEPETQEKPAQSMTEEQSLSETNPMTEIEAPPETDPMTEIEAPLETELMTEIEAPLETEPETEFEKLLEDHPMTEESAEPDSETESETESGKLPKTGDYGVDKKMLLWAALMFGAGYLVCDEYDRNYAKKKTEKERKNT